MRTILRKLFGASTGGGACLSFFVFALTGLISGIPLAARAQDSVTVGTVTFRDKTATSVTVEGPLTFSGHETRAQNTVEWVAQPLEEGQTQAAFDGSFTFRLDGLQQVGDQAPSSLPETAALSAVEMQFLANQTGNVEPHNENVRHLTVTDEAGSVLAVSAEADPIPTGEGTEQIVFAFPELPQLSLSTLYKGYFTATAPEVGTTFDTATTVQTRITFYTDSTAIAAGNQVSGFESFCLAAKFTLQTEASSDAGTSTRLLYAYHFDETDGTNIIPLNAGSGDRSVARLTGGFKTGITLTPAGTGAAGTANAILPDAAGQDHESGLFLWNKSGLGCGSDTGFTISFFMKRNEFESAANRDFAILGFAVGSQTYYLGRYANDQTIVLYPNANPSWASGHAYSWTLNDTDWHHVALTYQPDVGGTDAAGIVLYVDGVRAGDWYSSSREPEGQLTGISIGRGTKNGMTASSTNDPTWLNALKNTFVDEFGLFDRTLTAEEIAWLAQNPVGLPPTAVDAAEGQWSTINQGVAFSRNNHAAISRALVRFNSTLSDGAYAPETIPETVTLRGITVPWSSSTDNENAEIRRLVLVDAAGQVAAVSDAAVPTPEAYRVSSFFAFSDAPELSSSEQYTIYFMGDTTPAVGDTFGTQTTLDPSVVVYTGASGAETGCYAYDNEGTMKQDWSPGFAYHFAPLPEQPLGALNINFDTDANRLADDTLYGVAGVQYPGSQWNTITGGSSATDVSVTDTNGASLSVDYAGRAIEGPGVGGDKDPLLEGILADSGTDNTLPHVTIEGIPYNQYDVYVYMIGSAWSQNGSVTLNDASDTYYYMEAGKEVASIAQSSTAWGNAQATALALGQNVIRIADVSGETLKIHTVRIASVARNNIAAIQIVERKRVGAHTWEGTVETGAVNASAVEVTNTSTGAVAKLTELSADDEVRLSFTGTVSLTVDADVDAASLTLTGAEGARLITVANGGSLRAAEISIEGGAVMTANGTFVSEAPINLAEGATLQIQGTNGADFTQAVTGAGAVVVAAGNDVTLGADFTHTGGTTVGGTLRYGGHALGAVTVNAGGVFDLNGHACAQSITLNGGTLRADEAINETVCAHYVASVDFNNSANGATAIPSDTVAGVLGMRGEYWTVANGSNGNGTLTFYAETAIAGAGAARAAESTLSWDSGAVWGAGSNWQYLHGYLDDRQTNPGTVTLSIPEAYAEAGYALYLYSNTDDGAVFSAREIIGDDGVTTAYTYVNGALTTGNTTGWGNINAGRTTVAEGTNLMVIPDLHHRGPVIRLWDRTLNNVRNRGCLAAMQIVANSPTFGNVAGPLSVTGADSKIEIADGLGISFVGSITVSGEGTLSKVGTGTMTLLGAAVTGDFAITEGVAALNEASVSGTITVNNENGLTLDAASYEGLTVNLPEAATAQATAESVTIGALTGEGSFDFNGATRLTLANATDAFTGTYANATAATLAVSGGTLAVTDAQIAQVGVLRAEGGTLALPNAEVKDLEVAGGAVTGPGGDSLTAYTEISSGSVALTAAGTAASARPAAATADAATVSNFTLAEGGTIYYNTPDDRDLYFPAGFIPFRGAGADTQPYVIVLGEDFADFATFPFSFTVLGADTDASFTLQRPDDTAAPKASYTADGSVITVWNVGAIIDYSEDLPQARYHYAFDGNLNSTVSETPALTNENGAFVTSENGQALSAGSPYVTGGDFSFSGAWTLGLYLNVAEAAPHVTLFHAAVQAGFTSPGALFLTTGETADEIVLWRRNNSNTDYDALVTADLGLGGANAWHHVLITHTDTRIRLYVDGEMVGEDDGTFENTYTGIQIGKGLGGNSVPDHTNGAGSFQLDDVTIWPAALRDVQIEKALATTTAAWRIREGETPAELFTADAPWTRTDGTSDVFATADEDATTLTARATLSVKAGAEELFTALQSFTARYVLLEGEPLTYALTTLTAPTSPANIQTLVVDNDLTLDLSAVNLAMASQIAAEPEGYCILPIRWRGALTLTHIPDGFDFDIEARDDGVYLTFAAGGAGSVRALNINFDTNANRLDANTLYGLEGVQYPGSQWNTLTTVSNGSVASGLSVTDTVGNPLTVSYFGKGFETFANSEYNPLLKTVLMDGGGGDAVNPYVQIAGIPYAAYDAYIYMVSNFNDGVNNFHNAAVQVNDGDYYTMLADQDAATVVDAPSQGVWAVGQDPRQVALGVTVMRIAGLSDETLKLTTTHRSGGGRGNIAAVQVVAFAPLYTRTVNGTDAWEATDAWTNVNDGSTVDLPPRGARLMVETTDAAILTVSEALPAYDSLTIVGGGSLALSVNGQNLLTDDEYKAIPRGQAHTVTILDATIDPTQVTAWVSALKYGATAAVSVAEGGITAKVTLPDAAYPSDQLDESESISFNFTDFYNRDGTDDGVGAIADDAMGASGTPYETYGEYWAEPTTREPPASNPFPATEPPLSAPVVLNTARGAAGADTSKKASVTYNVYHGWGSGIGGTAQPILQAFANGHSLSGGAGTGGIPSVSVEVPGDWGTYTAVVYMSTDSGSKHPWLPKRVNGTFYYYDAAGELATLTDETQATTVGGLPDEVKDTTHAWGGPTSDGSLVEGTNMMVIPGLSGNFKLEFWSKPADSGNNVNVSQTQGRVAAFQLIEDAEVVYPSDDSLGTVQIYQATLAAGDNDWANLAWTINGDAAEDAPGAGDAVELTLAGDATLTFGPVTTVASITVYGQGHALRVTDAAEATATWTFRNDAILALGEGDVLPETIDTNPKRVRYDYAYGQAGQTYTTTSAYETEFAAGFTGNLTPNGGLVEFSAGQVTVGTWNATATATEFVFSGKAQLTMTGDAAANGMRIGTATVTFRDAAQASLSRIHLRAGGTGRTSTVILEDEAVVAVTGAVNNTQNNNDNTLQFAEFAGTAVVTVRDNARFVAEKATLLLTNDGLNQTTTFTVEDNAEVRVKGVARRSQSIGIINLNGGRFLIGSDGFRAYTAGYSGATLEMHFNGGVLGAWQAWTWDGTTAGIVTTVTGDPILETSRNVTLTLAAGSNLFATAQEATVRGEGTVTSALTTLPSLTLEGGTFATTVAAQASSVSLSGGTLALSGGALRLADGLETHGVGSVRIPVSPSGAAGWLAMADGGLVPNVANVVFTLALNLAGADSLLPYRVPLFMGAYRNNVEPTCGFAYSGNVNNAVSTATPVYVKGNQGQGLYAQLAGNAVVQPHTQALNATNPGNISQATASVYDYWIFKAETVGGKLTVADGGVGIKDVSFEGLSAVITASGATPHPLLQTETLGITIPVTFDLTAWKDALDVWAAGAVRDVPASLCLASGRTTLVGLATLTGWDPPAGVEARIVAGERGLYLVATSDRLASTVSVNFSTRANPLSSTPAAPGAYAVPVSAWNDLRGLFSSALLYVSDIGGAATVQATRGEGEAAQPTQVSSTSTAIVTGATPSLLQAWLSDAAATTLRVANVPFARYRLALIFSNDLGDAAFSTVTVGSDVYAMDAAGYVRKNVTGLGKVAGDTQWGSTTIDTENYFRQGNNVLLTDVITTPSVSVSLPAAVYGRTYAGVAAVQVIEAPDTATSEEGAVYAYDFAAATDDADGDGLVEANLADLGLTIDGTAGQTWQSGPNNTLALTVPQGLDVTLTLPLNFQADTISATGEGSLTLQVEENGGAALSTLNAANLGNLTVHFPCVGVAFTPADGVSRFEAAFNNNGETYTIAEGATLALGENSGIAVSLDRGASTDRTGASATINVDTGTSVGTLRRDYVVPSIPNQPSGTESDMTMAFKAGTAQGDPVNIRANLLVEDGDVLRVPNKYHFSGASLIYTQTGGLATFESADATQGGFLLLANASPDNATAEVFLGGRNGARLETPVVWSWRSNARVTLDVSGDATLAVGNMGLRANNATARLEATFSEDGTLELSETSLGTGGNGTVSTTFNGGRIASVQNEASLTLPVTFAGTDAPTTIDPGKYGTLVLNAANQGNGAIAVPRGTVAIANANGLGNATATIADGAAFESRGFTGEHEGAEEARAIPVVAIKIDIPAGVGASDGTAIQELCLYNGEKKVEWPTGTTITGTGDRATATWSAGGNEYINALIDGVMGADATLQNVTYTNPANGSKGEYSGQSVSIKSNKWYVVTNNTRTGSATITLPGGAVFNSYTFWNSDTAGRFPNNWTFSVRYENDPEGSWTEIPRSGAVTRPAANTESAKFSVPVRTEGGATTLDDVTGRVVFQAGAQCRAVRKAGAPGLPYVARIAGTIDLPDSGKDGIRFFLDDEEFAVANVTVNEGNGTVTFGAGDPITVTDVIWDVMNPTGTWADGSTGPWVDGATFRNGAGVSFPAPTGDAKIAVSVLGAPRPGAAFSVGGDLDYTFFETEPGDRIDLSAAEVNEYPSVDAEEDANDITVRAIELGAATYDVPINTGAANRGISANGSVIRLAGALSADGKTATLLGSGNLNAVGASPHGVWFDGSDTPCYLTLSPHAGERQRLSLYSAHLKGDGQVVIAGQVETEATVDGEGIVTAPAVVSGGTVEFGGAFPANNTACNNAFTGSFEIRDGATLDVTLSRPSDGQSNYDDWPVFRTANAGEQDALYQMAGEVHNTGFTLRNGGTLRVAVRGLTAGWENADNAAIVLNNTVKVGANSTYRLDFTANNVLQYMIHSLPMDGDGATLSVGGTSQSNASQRGLGLLQGTNLTVAGIGEACDPDSVGARRAEGTDGFALTSGITARIVADNDDAVLRLTEFGLTADPHFYFDVHDGSTLVVDAPLALTDAAADGTSFVKVGPGRMTLEWPEIANLVEVEVEEGTLGGTAAFTDSASTITVAAGATIEAGLSVPTLTVEDGATLAIDPTGALQLRADTALFDNRGTYLVTALTEPAEATGREPIKVVSWANAPESVNAAFQADDALATAGYGLEVRTDGLYLMPAVTYYRELSGIGSADSYQLLWDDPAWYTSLADVGQADKAGAFNPTEGVTVNVVFLLPTSSAIDQLRDIVIGLSGPTVFSSLCVASRGSDDTLTVLDPNITYTYELRNETPPAEGEVKVFEWLSSLVYTTGTRTEVARLQATVPDNTAYTVDGTSVILYRVAEGRAAINVSFAAGTEGTPSWLPAETAPCGPVPYAGVYWNNITATTGTPLTTSGANHEVYQTSITVSGLVDDANNPETASLTYAYSTSNGFGSVNNRALNGDARLAAGFLRGANTAFTAIIGDLEAPGVNAGWTVRVSDIPFASYDLYLLFAGSADGAVNYPAVRVKVGNEAWRTYAFVNGWTSPAGDAAWSGQGYSDQGFVDGLNLLHLRIEGAEGGAIQIAPCDSAATTAVGLAGLQIVELDANDPVYYRFAGTRWGDGSSWLLSGDNTRGAWADATLKAPHHARFDNTITALEVDREAAAPFLRFDGVTNLTVTGEPGVLSIGGLDFTDVTTAGTVTFEEDVFAQPPEVVLGSALTLELPEPASGTLDNDWRWRYGNDAAHGATLRKTKAGGLRLTHSVGNNLRIDNGTLWLTAVTSNASTNYPYTVTGEGTLGWDGGNNTLRIAFNNLPAGNTDPEGAFLRLSSGTVTLRSTGDLPADRAIVIDGGTVQFSKDGQRLFSNGRFLVRNGGTLHYNGSDASNLFSNDNASVIAQLPSVFLDGGRLQDTVWNGGDQDLNATVHDLNRLVSQGTSRIYVASPGSNAWDHKTMNVRSGSIVVDDGYLVIDSALTALAVSKNSIVLLPNAETSASYGDSGTTTGYIDVATGAHLYSGYPIYAGSSGSNNTLVKVGGGVWAQVQNVCQSVGYNGGGKTDNGGSDPYCNIEIREGVFRLNMGEDVLEVPADTADRTITIKNGARIEGVGTIAPCFDVTIESGATLLSGMPDDVVWVPTDGSYPWTFPDNIRNYYTTTAGRNDGSVDLNFQGDLTFADGAILEFNLNRQAQRLRTAEDSTVTFNGTLTVRLTNMPMSIAEPVLLTNFGTTPTGLIESAIVCPEAIAIDAKVRLCTAAEATGEEGADDTINNIWLIPSGASHIWTEATGAWSESKWTVGTQANQPIRNGNNTESSSERPDPSNPDKSPTARVESANGVTLTIDKPTEPTMANPNATDALNFWGAYGLILSGAGDITLAQGGALTAGNPPTGALYGVDVGTSFWKLGTGNATIESILRLYGTGSTFTVSGGTLTLKRPILQAENLASQDQQGVQLLNPFEIGSGATLTLDFALPEGETEAATLRNYYDDVLGIDIPIGMSDDVLVAQAQSLAGSLTGSGTLRVQGEGTTVRIGSDDSSASIADSGVNFSVGTGATLFLTANLTGSGAATRTAAVEPGAILDLQAERALGSADWTLNLAAGADDEDTTTPDGALVRSDRDIRLRGTVAVTGTGTATLGADLSVDDSLAVEVPAGAVLTLSGSTIGMPEDAAEDAVFTKRGAGVLDVTSGNFELGLPVSVEAGTLRLTGSLPSTIRPSDDRTIDWTVGPGGTLAFNGATRFDLDVYGDLTVEAGGTLALTGSSGVSILGDPLLAAGSTVSFGNGEALPNATDSGVLTFFNGVTVDGTVTVVINALPARLPQSGVTLISFGDGTGNRHGNGTFVLGGDTAADIAAAGYTLRDNGASVTLEPFGGDLLYTWAATGDDPASSTDWTGTNWVIRNGDKLVAWPETTSTTPAVILPENSPLTGEATIPTAFRTISWTGEAQTLAGLQASNEAANADGTAGGDYTLTGTSTLTIDGSLLKTGSGGLTFNRPVSVSSSGALSLFGGTVTFANAASLTGASVDLNDATLAFTGDTDVTVSGRLAGNGNGVVRKAGAGVLTVSTTIGETIDRFDVDGGTLRLTANAQADVLTPTFDMAAGTTLALRGSVVGGATIEPTFAEGNTGFTLLWEGSAPTSTADSPVLGTVPATTFEYRPASGHLILDPESLPEGAALVLGDDITETNALRLGAGQGGTAIRLGALTAPRGAVIGVEPTVDLAAGDWATERALTLALTANATCGATFMGAPLSAGTVVRAGLTVEKAAGAAADPILTYIGESDHNALGTLTAGNGARVEVTGTWAGPAAALSGGTLAGNGVIGAAGTTSGNVEVALGGILSASVTSSATGLVTPAELTVRGDLAIHDGARLDVSAAVQADGTTAVSHVVTDSVTFVENRVNIDVYLDAPADAAVNGKPILSWSSFNGTTAVTGTVKVYNEATGNWDESNDYSVIQEGNSLVLRRASNRFWMILR